MTELYKKAGVLLENEVRKRQSLEKQAAQHGKAAELAFKQVEMGLCAPFKTYEEFKEKTAALMEQDLSVVEKAMEMGFGSQNNVGKLESESTKKDTDALTHFINTGEVSK